MTVVDWLARYAWYLSTVVTALLFLKLRREKLLRVYPWFSVLLAWNVLAGAVMAPVPYRTRLYAILYFGFESVRWILHVLTSLDLAGSVLRRYPGIASLGRWIVTTALTIAVLAALWTMTFPQTTLGRGPGANWFNGMMLLGQVITVSILIFLVLTVGFLLWFRVPLPANAIRLFLGYALTFVVGSSTYLSLNLRGFGAAAAVGLVRMAVILACMVYWLLRLRAVDETAAVTLGPRPNAVREDHLVEQLSAINASLLRYLRK